jgi:3-methyladenine DNA glycosylase AlkD
MEYQELLKLLFAQRDEKYSEFNKKIVNTQIKIIGVRSPDLGKIIKKLKKESIDPTLWPWHDYLEVDFLIASMMLSHLNNLESKYTFIGEFLKETDNWAVVDSLSGGFEVSDFSIALKWIKKFSVSKYPFVRRFAYVHALNNFVHKEYLPDIFKVMKPDEHYYVRMGQAWLLTECFLEDSKATEAFLKENPLDDWTINKAISKIHDSFRVDSETKEYLKKYRRSRKS